MVWFFSIFKRKTKDYFFAVKVKQIFGDDYLYTYFHGEETLEGRVILFEDLSEARLAAENVRATTPNLESVTVVPVYVQHTRRKRAV